MAKGNAQIPENYSGKDATIMKQGQTEDGLYGGDPSKSGLNKKSQNKGV